jgi:hypothetical protein
MKYRVWCLRNNCWHPGEGNAPTTREFAARYAAEVANTVVRPYPAPTPKRDVRDPMMREISYEQAIDILTKQGGDAREVVLVSPTPPATVEGEWKQWQSRQLNDSYEVVWQGGSYCILFSTEQQAQQVAASFNNYESKLSTLAAENARLRAALQEVVTAITNEIASDEEPCWSAVFDNVLVIASAELRGGAK